jgi:hypothetical protein
VIGVLRFIGVINAAIWFGSAIFFTFVSGPAFFSSEMVRMIPPPYNGVAAQLIIQRYFILNYVCGSIAIIHLIGEWLYTGRPERLTLGVILTLFCLSLLGGFWIQPKLRGLHYAKYRGATAEERQAATQSFGKWHGISQVANLVVTIGLLLYLWRVTSLNHPSRHPGFRKLSIGWK